MRGTKKIDWLNHFLEFIVVVIGILLAFQLNTCRDDSKEDKLINEHIANIVEESKFNLKNLTEGIAYSESVLQKIDTLLSEQAKNGNVQKMNGLAFQALKINPLYIKKTAYNSLIQSGDVRFISNFTLKDQVIQLYEYYNWADGVDEMTMSTYRNFYFPYLVENFDMTRGQPQETQIYTNKEFKNIVSSYRYALDARITQNKTTLEKIETFITTYDTKK